MTGSQEPSLKRQRTFDDGFSDEEGDEFLLADIDEAPIGSFSTDTHKGTEYSDPTAVKAIGAAEAGPSSANPFRTAQPLFSEHPTTESDTIAKLNEHINYLNGKMGEMQGLLQMHSFKNKNLEREIARLQAVLIDHRRISEEIVNEERAKYEKMQTELLDRIALQDQDLKNKEFRERLNATAIDANVDDAAEAVGELAQPPLQLRKVVAPDADNRSPKPRDLSDVFDLKKVFRGDGTFPDGIPDVSDKQSPVRRFLSRDTIRALPSMFGFPEEENKDDSDEKKVTTVDVGVQVPQPPPAVHHYDISKQFFEATKEYAPLWKALESGEKIYMWDLDRFDELSGTDKNSKRVIDCLRKE